MCVAGESFLKEIGLKNSILKHSLIKLESANHSFLKVLGTMRCKIYYASLETEICLFICENVSEFLINRKAMIDLGIIHKDFPKPLPFFKSIKSINRNYLPTIPTDQQCEDIKTNLIEEYKDVFRSDGILKPMKGNPVHVYLKENVVPYAIFSPRKIPFAWRQQVKDELDEMCQKKIIQAVEDSPADFVSPLVVVQKPNGKLRICVDFTKLNIYVKRPTHPFKAPWDAVSNIDRKANYFSTLDATNGYWQLELDKESQSLTTFLTPWGRFKFLRAPMGLVSSGDEYCRRGDSALSGIGNIQKVVDDILAYDETFEQHFTRIVQILDRCRAEGITLNENKFIFAKPEVSFVGYKITSQGIKADPKKVDAIKNFKRPENITQLRSFMGLVNQLGSFSSNISRAAIPLRTLLKIKNEFLWTAVHDQSFDNVRNALVEPPVLAHFDPSLPTALHSDASRLHGLGYVLLQKHDDTWKLIQCGSRFLTETESRYAMIEIELLGITWAVTKCRIYLLGQDSFKIVTDHKPLLSILNDQTLDGIENPRLQRLKEKIAGYSFVAEWKKGSDHLIPDALSRNPATFPTEEDLVAEDSKNSVNSFVIRKISIADNTEESTRISHLQDPMLLKLEECAKQDTTYQKLKNQIQIGFPEFKKNLEDILKPYWSIRNDLSCENELLLKGCQVIIPANARKMTLERLHDSHQGIERTKRRARQTVYWPSMGNDIRNIVENCEICQTIRPSLANESYMSDPLPDLPFHDVSADLFSYAGKHYMVYVDRLSGWPIVCQYGNKEPNSSKIISDLRKIFADTGVPLRFRSDNGPQFASYEFKTFLKLWNVSLCPSTPYYPQSNGHAEAAVKSMKTLLKKSVHEGKLDEQKYFASLLEWRNTPKIDGRSPSQVLFGHPLRSLVPAHFKSFSSEWQNAADLCDRKSAQYKKNTCNLYNKSAKDLKPIPVGSTVRIQNPISKLWDTIGTVVDVGETRNYTVKMPSGRLFVRNRRFLRQA